MAVEITERDVGISAIGLSGLERKHYGRYLDIAIPGGIVLFIVLACFLGPIVFSIPGPNAGSLTQALEPMFSRGHLLGTDALGNDLLSRSLYGGRLSFEVGISTSVIGLSIGGTIGVIAGYRGGVVETVLMRLMDVILAFPFLILALAIAAYLGPSEQNEIAAISFFSVPIMCRIARGVTLRLREQGFIVSAKLAGGKDGRILLKHVIPNVFPSMMTFAILAVGIAMIAEAALGYLGVGVRPPTPSWGNMISSGELYLASNPTVVFVPGVILAVTVVSINLLGDALRARLEAR